MMSCILHLDVIPPGYGPVQDSGCSGSGPQSSISGKMLHYTERVIAKYQAERQ